MDEILQLQDVVYVTSMYAISCISTYMQQYYFIPRSFINLELHIIIQCLVYNIFHQSNSAHAVLMFIRGWRLFISKSASHTCLQSIIIMYIVSSRFKCSPYMTFVKSTVLTFHRYRFNLHSLLRMGYLLKALENSRLARFLTSYKTDRPCTIETSIV